MSEHRLLSELEFTAEDIRTFINEYPADAQRRVSDEPFRAYLERRASAPKVEQFYRQPDPMTVAARCPGCGIPAPTLDAAAAVTDTHHPHLSPKLRAAADHIRRAP